MPDVAIPDFGTPFAPDQEISTIPFSYDPYSKAFSSPDPNTYDFSQIPPDYGSPLPKSNSGREVMDTPVSPVFNTPSRLGTVSNDPVSDSKLLQDAPLVSPTLSNILANPLPKNELTSSTLSTLVPTTQSPPISPGPTPSPSSPAPNSPTTLTASQLGGSVLSMSQLGGKPAGGRGALMKIKVTYSGNPSNFMEYRTSSTYTLQTKVAKKLELNPDSLVLFHGNVPVDSASLLGDLTQEATLELTARTDAITLQVNYGTETWKIAEVRTTTCADLYQKTATRFQLAKGEFAIEIFRRTLPDQQAPLGDQIPPDVNSIELNVIVGPSVVVIVPQEGQITYRVALNYPILDLYSKVAVRLQQAFEQFFFSPSEYILLPHDTDIQVHNLLREGSSCLTLNYISSNSVVDLSVVGPDAKFLLGFPPTTPVATIWEKIENLFPRTIIFTGDKGCTLAVPAERVAGDFKPPVTFHAVPKQDTFSVSLLVDGSEFLISTLASTLVKDVLCSVTPNFEAYVFKGT